MNARPPNQFGRGQYFTFLAPAKSPVSVLTCWDWPSLRPRAEGEAGSNPGVAGVFWIASELMLLATTSRGDIHHGVLLLASCNSPVGGEEGADSDGDDVVDAIFAWCIGGIEEQR